MELLESRAVRPRQVRQQSWCHAAVFRINSPRLSPVFGGGLSRLVHQRAARKPISDARTATYVILSTGSGPGGRRFKSFRPDHSLLSICFLSSSFYQLRRLKLYSRRSRSPEDRKSVV